MTDKNLEKKTETERTTEATSPQQAVPKNDAGVQDVSGDEVENDSKNPNAEAAKYRKRLRDTEAERDALAAKIEAYQRAEVEQYAEHLQKPSAIWAAGIELADLLDDEGNIDPEKTTAAVEAAATDLGLSTRPRAPRPHPAQMSGGAAPNGEKVEDALARVIRGGHA